MQIGKLTRLRTQNPGIGMHSISSMSRTPGCTFLHGSPVNLQDLPDAGSWSTVLAQKQGKYTREDLSNESKQTNKIPIKWVAASPLPSLNPDQVTREDLQLYLAFWNSSGSSSQWEGFQSSFPGMDSLLTPYLTSSRVVLGWSIFFKSAQGADTTNWTLLLPVLCFPEVMSPSLKYCPSSVDTTKTTIPMKSILLVAQQHLGNALCLSHSLDHQVNSVTVFSSVLVFCTALPKFWAF